MNAVFLLLIHSPLRLLSISVALCSLSTPFWFQVISVIIGEVLKLQTEIAWTSPLKFGINTVGLVSYQVKANPRDIDVNNSYLWLFYCVGQLISGLDLPSSHTKPDGIPCVSAQDLYNLLTGENVSKVLVLDCRPHSMFLQNHINRPSCINIPAELLDQG